MSSNQATYTAIFEASNQIEVVRACLKADIEVSPDKAIENDGMRIILESIVESLAKHIEVLMDEESAEKEVNKVKAKPAIKDKQAVKELNADEQHACSMLDQICTLSNAVIGQARDSVQLCSSEEEQTANTFISIATMVLNIGWMGFIYGENKWYK